MSQLNLLALELTQAHIVRLFFFSPTPLIVILAAMKKCAMPLSEPLDDHRPRSKWFKEVDVFVGPRGYCHICVHLFYSTLGLICYNLLALIYQLKSMIFFYRP